MPLDRSHWLHFVAVGLLAGALAGCGSSDPAAPTAPRVAPKVWGEAELSVAVKGKSPAEVRKLLGEPTSTTGDPDTSATPVEWVYALQLHDKQANRMADAHIWFDGKKATGRVK